MPTPKEKCLLYVGLNKYISDEELDDYLCEKCGKKQAATKTQRINQAPRILIATINVFKSDRTKITRKMIFPKVLDLKDYMEDGICKL